MAVSTLCISQKLKLGLALTPPTLISNYAAFGFRFSSKPRKLVFSIKSSNDTSSSSSVETSKEEEAEGGDSSIELPPGPPYSIISTLNVERALRGIPITDVDHYGRLGLTRDASYDQINNAYKSKCEELLKQLGSEEAEQQVINQKLEMLKESYTILSTPEEKRLFDWSIARSEKPDRYVWPFEVDSTKQSPQDPPPREPEDYGPTRAVGYFILGWILLSFVLSIALNL